MVICLERDANLHIAQQMPLSLTVSCFSKIQIGFSFLVPAHLGSPGQRAVKRVCVCACVRACGALPCSIQSGVCVTVLCHYGSLLYVPKLGNHNKLLLSWLLTCSGVSYLIAQHFTFGPHAPSPPTSAPKLDGRAHFIASASGCREP